MSFFDTMDEVEAYVDQERANYLAQWAAQYQPQEPSSLPLLQTASWPPPPQQALPDEEPFEFLDGGFLPPLLARPPANERPPPPLPFEIEQFQPPLGAAAAAVPDFSALAAAQAAAQAAAAAGWVPALWSAAPPPPPPPRLSSAATSSSSSSSAAATAADAAALQAAQAFAAAYPLALPPPSGRRPKKLTVRAAALALVAAAQGGAPAAAAAVWTRPRVKPLPLTFDTGWQIDFGQVPNRAPTGNKPAPASRAKFQSYQPTAQLAPYFSHTLSLNQPHSHFLNGISGGGGENSGGSASHFLNVLSGGGENSGGSASHFLNYTARGNVRPEQHKLESCAYNGSRGVLSSSVTTSYTPYTHAHEMDAVDMESLPAFAEIDPDNQTAPKSMTLHLLPSPTDGHTHTVELSLSQAKTIMSGRPLTTSSSEPNDQQVASHVHMVTIGC